MKYFFAVMALAAVLSGCTAPAAAPAAIVEVTRLVDRTVIVTTTPGPTQTPHIIVVTATPSPTPVIDIWTADSVLDVFIAAGLEVGEPVEMTKDDNSIAPIDAVKAIHFFLPSLCSDCGGRIIAYDDLQNLKITQAYYESLGEQSSAFFSWVFEKDNILVQINGELPEEQARKYEQALNAIGN